MYMYVIRDYMISQRPNVPSALGLHVCHQGLHDIPKTKRSLSPWVTCMSSGITWYPKDQTFPEPLGYMYMYVTRDYMISQRPNVPSALGLHVCHQGLHDIPKTKRSLSPWVTCMSSGITWYPKDQTFPEPLGYMYVIRDYMISQRPNVPSALGLHVCHQGLHDIPKTKRSLSPWVTCMSSGITWYPKDQTFPEPLGYMYVIRDYMISQRPNVPWALGLHVCHQGLHDIPKTKRSLSPWVTCMSSGITWYPKDQTFPEPLGYMYVIRDYMISQRPNVPWALGLHVHVCHQGLHDIPKTKRSLSPWVTCMSSGITWYPKDQTFPQPLGYMYVTRDYMISQRPNVPWAPWVTCMSSGITWYPKDQTFPEPLGYMYVIRDYMISQRPNVPWALGLHVCHQGLHDIPKTKRSLSPWVTCMSSGITWYPKDQTFPEPLGYMYVIRDYMISQRPNVPWALGLHVCHQGLHDIPKTKRSLSPWVTCTCMSPGITWYPKDQTFPQPLGYMYVIRDYMISQRPNVPSALGLHVCHQGLHDIPKTKRSLSPWVTCMSSGITWYPKDQTFPQPLGYMYVIRDYMISQRPNVPSALGLHVCHQGLHDIPKTKRSLSPWVTCMSSGITWYPKDQTFPEPLGYMISQRPNVPWALGLHVCHQGLHDIPKTKRSLSPWVTCMSSGITWYPKDQTFPEPLGYMYVIRDYMISQRPNVPWALGLHVHVCHQGLHDIPKTKRSLSPWVTCMSSGITWYPKDQTFPQPLGYMYVTRDYMISQRPNVPWALGLHVCHQGLHDIPKTKRSLSPWVTCMSSGITWYPKDQTFPEPLGYMYVIRDYMISQRPNVPWALGLHVCHQGLHDIPKTKRSLSPWVTCMSSGITWYPKDQTFPEPLGYMYVIRDYMISQRPNVPWALGLHVHVCHQGLHDIPKTKRSLSPWVTCMSSGITWYPKDQTFPQPLGYMYVTRDYMISQRPNVPWALGLHVCHQGLHDIPKTKRSLSPWVTCMSSGITWYPKDQTFPEPLGYMYVIRDYMISQRPNVPWALGLHVCHQGLHDIPKTKRSLSPWVTCMSSGITWYPKDQTFPEPLGYMYVIRDYMISQRPNVPWALGLHVCHQGLHDIPKTKRSLSPWVTCMSSGITWYPKDQTFPEPLGYMYVIRDYMISQRPNVPSALGLHVCHQGLHDIPKTKRSLSPWVTCMSSGITWYPKDQTFPEPLGYMYVIRDYMISQRPNVPWALGLHVCHQGLHDIPKTKRSLSPWVTCMSSGITWYPKDQTFPQPLGYMYVIRDYMISQRPNVPWALGLHVCHQGLHDIPKTKHSLSPWVTCMSSGITWYPKDQTLYMYHQSENQINPYSLKFQYDFAHTLEGFNEIFEQWPTMYMYQWETTLPCNVQWCDSAQKGNHMRPLASTAIAWSGLRRLF